MEVINERTLDTGEDPQVSNPQICSAPPRVTNKGVSAYNTESLTVDYNGQRV